MAEELLDKFRDLAEGQIDFKGQTLAELLATLLLSLTGIISFFAGYLLQDIKLAVYIGLIGTAVSFVAVVPPWPFFNRSPVAWLEPGPRTQSVMLVEKEG